MNISESKEYSMFLMGNTQLDIEKQIAKKWESRDFAEQAYKQIEILEQPDRSTYQFILAATLGHWKKCSEALEYIEGDTNRLNAYQIISLKRMKAMIHIAEDESIRAVEILESVYGDIPDTHAWLQRTVAVDIRNITLQYFMSDKSELAQKGEEWRRRLLDLTDHNPLLDVADRNSLDAMIEEFFEAGTTSESSVRFSNKIREALEYQFKSLFLSARLGYYTGMRTAKRNIALILYQWANIHSDSFLYTSALYEFIENGNKTQIEKIFSKHADVLVGNRTNAILLFEKIKGLSAISLLQGIKLIVSERIYDFLGDDDCEVIDGILVETLNNEQKDVYSRELKRSAMKVILPLSRRIAPIWFLEFAIDKLKKDDEPWWFYSELFRILGSIEVSKCDEHITIELLKVIIDYFRSKRTMEDFDGIRVLFNLAAYSTEGYTIVDDFLSEKYGSKESAFKKYPLYFTYLNHPEMLNIYQDYIRGAIKEFDKESRQAGPSKSVSIVGYNTGDVIQNIVKKHFPQVGDSALFDELVNVSINACLNPNIGATKKRSIFELIKILEEKMGASKLFKERLSDIRDRFNDFATAIEDRNLAARLRPTILGALAGSTYLKMGGDLSPSLWNHIWRDKSMYYDNRIDCVEAMSEIAEKDTQYSMLSFYVLSEFINDEFFPVSRKALISIAGVKGFPKNIIPMLCQSIFKASYSGNISVRIAATYCIKKICEIIENAYWRNQLGIRLKELESDDCRPVRLQAVMPLREEYS